MKQILITTTPTLSNANIIQYCGIVTTNVVIGVNFFSDFMASFSDFFGGNSSTYQKKLDGIYEEVIQGLESKAMQKNANAIVGLHIDFDEISGKGKQMFMATAVGTACKIECIDDGNEFTDISQKASNSAVEQLCMSRALQEKFAADHWTIYSSDWDYILTHYMPELAPSLVAGYFLIPEYSKEIYMQNLNTYLSSLPYSLCVDAVYPLIEDHLNELMFLVEKHMLFNADKIINYIDKGNIHLVIKLLSVAKEHYNLEDLTKMELIIDKLENLPDKGKIEKVISGIFNKKEEYCYICPNGHKNAKDDEFCSKSDCRLNIKGLTLEEIEIIAKFKNKVEALRDILTV